MVEYLGGECLPASGRVLRLEERTDLVQPEPEILEERPNFSFGRQEIPLANLDYRRQVPIEERRKEHVHGGAGRDHGLAEQQGEVRPAKECSREGGSLADQPQEQVVEEENNRLLAVDVRDLEKAGQVINSPAVVDLRVEEAIDLEQHLGRSEMRFKHRDRLHAGYSTTICLPSSRS